MIQEKQVRLVKTCFRAFHHEILVAVECVLHNQSLFPLTGIFQGFGNKHAIQSGEQNLSETFLRAGGIQGNIQNASGYATENQRCAGQNGVS